MMKNKITNNRINKRGHRLSLCDYSLKTEIDRRNLSTWQDSTTNKVKNEVVVETGREGWNDIDWKKINSEMEALQEEIVIATKKCKYSDVYKLQRKLVNSFAGRALAVRKVVTNSGSKTAGIDNIKWNGAKDYWAAIQDLKNIVSNPNSYKAKPLLRVFIPKGNTGEMRPLGIPTLRDRTVQAVYHLAVDPAVEVKSDKNSYGFRKYRSTHNAIVALRNHLDKDNHPRWILDADLSKCFDRISHEFLMEHTPICDKAILQQWLKSGVMENKEVKTTEEGTPQGGIISPTLCNIALNGIEAEVLKVYPLKKGISAGVHIIRYADDMVVTGKSKEIINEIKDVMARFLKIRGLEFNEGKTIIVNIKEGFDFLGFHIVRRAYNPRLNNKTSQDSVLIVEPSEKGIKKIKETIAKVIMKSNSPIERIIADLNPALRGWGEHKRISYHSQRMFIKIDHYVYLKMMKWAAKHGGSLRETVRKNTVKTINRKWNWGKTETAKILNLAEIPIIKMSLFKLDKNPYLIEDKEYFLKRKENAVFAKFRAAIYKKHQNTCPHCKESLFNGERIELHHIDPRKKGGKYKINNIQPLHQICHQQITHAYPKS